MDNYIWEPKTYDDFLHNARQLAYRYEMKSKANDFHWWMWEIGVPYAIHFHRENIKTREEIDTFMQLEDTEEKKYVRASYSAVQKLSIPEYLDELKKKQETV